MTDERRAVLESIAFAADPAIRPAERLRALELLNDADREKVCFCDQVAGLSLEELHRMEDEILAALVFSRDADPADSMKSTWPQTAAALEIIMNSQK